MADVLYDYEDNTLQGWTIVDNNFGLRSDRARGTYSLGINAGSGGNPLAYIEPSELSGGEQINYIEGYWQETSSSTGHGLMVQDSSGNDVLGVASGNPQFEIDSGNGFSRDQNEVVTSYDVWLYWKVTFDWQNGDCDIYIFNEAEGVDKTYTNVPLKNNTNVARLEMRNNSREDWSSSGPCYSWQDNVLFNYDAPNQPGNVFVTESGVKQTVATGVLDTK